MYSATATVLPQCPAVLTRHKLVHVMSCVKTFVQDRLFAEVAMTTPALILMTDGQFVSVSTETYQYLQLEAAQRGVSVAEVYCEEAQAREELKRLTLPRDRLERAAQQDYSHHPWWSGNETKPF